MKTVFPTLAFLMLVVPWLAHGQTVNSGSNGSDGAFNPTKDTVINMADHPDGVYHTLPSGHGDRLLMEHPETEDD